MSTKEIQTKLRNANHQAKTEVLRFANDLATKANIRSSVVKYFNLCGND